jgi:hypothetical protein
VLSEQVSKLAQVSGWICGIQVMCVCVCVECKYNLQLAKQKEKKKKKVIWIDLMYNVMKSVRRTIGPH